MSSDTPPIPIGARVSYTGTHPPEVGVVVATWYDEKMEAWDCYVAFVGETWSAGKPKRMPYILRYFATSLDPI